MAPTPIVNTQHQKDALRRAGEVIQPFFHRLPLDDYSLILIRVQEALLEAYQRGRMGRGLG